MSVVVVAGDSAQVDFAGEGSLSVDIFEIDSRTIDFSGEGTFDVEVVEVEMVEVDFAGEGDLSLSIIDGENVVVTDVDFAGEGTFDAAVVEVEMVDVDVTSEATFDAAAVPMFEVDADFTSEGTLATQVVEAEDVPFAATAVGTFSVDLVTVHELEVGFAGEGTLSVDTEAIVIERQRMNKVARQAVSSGSWYDITGWSSDGTYPATISGGNMVIEGGGDVTVTLSWTLDTAFSTVWNVRVLRNSSVVYTSPNRSADGTYNEVFALTVADGDVLQVQAQRGTNATSMYFDVPSYLDVNPD